MNNAEPSCKHVDQNLANIPQYKDKEMYISWVSWSVRVCLQQQGAASGVKGCLKCNATSSFDIIAVCCRSIMGILTHLLIVYKLKSSVWRRKIPYLRSFNCIIQKGCWTTYKFHYQHPLNKKKNILFLPCWTEFVGNIFQFQLWVTPCYCMSLQFSVTWFYCLTHAAFQN